MNTSIVKLYVTKEDIKELARIDGDLIVTNACVNSLGEVEFTCVVSDGEIAEKQNRSKLI